MPCGVVSPASQQILYYVFQPSREKGREPKYVHELNIMLYSDRVKASSVLIVLLWFCNIKYLQGLFYCAYE